MKNCTVSNWRESRYPASLPGASTWQAVGSGRRLQKRIVARSTMQGKLVQQRPFEEVRAG